MHPVNQSLECFYIDCIPLDQHSSWSLLANNSDLNFVYIYELLYDFIILHACWLDNNQKTKRVLLGAPIKEGTKITNQPTHGRIFYNRASCPGFMPPDLHNYVITKHATGVRLGYSDPVDSPAQTDTSFEAVEGVLTEIQWFLYNRYGRKKWENDNNESLSTNDHQLMGDELSSDDEL